MSDVAFGRRVGSLPPIKVPSTPVQPSVHARTPAKEFRVGSILLSNGASTIAKQIIQRRIEKIEELLEIQRDRDKRETGVMRVLMGASRQRLMDIRRRRDVLREENVSLVARISELEAVSMARIAGQLDRHARFTSTSFALRGRGETERANIREEHGSVVAGKDAELDQLRTELWAIQEQTMRCKGEAVDLRDAGGETEDRLLLTVEGLRRQIEGERREMAAEVAALEAESERIRAAAAMDRELQLRDWADQIAQAAWTSMAPQVKAMAAENCHMRKEIEAQYAAGEELAATIAALEDKQRELKEQLGARKEKSAKPKETKGLPSRKQISAEAMRTIAELSASIHA